MTGDLESIDTKFLVSVKPFFSYESIQLLLDTMETSPKITCLRLANPLVPEEEAISVLAQECERLGLRYWRHDTFKEIFFVEVRALNDTRCNDVENRKGNALVIVDPLCGRAVMRGADIYAKGILAASAGMSKGDLVDVYAWRRKSSRLFIKRGEKITQKEANECVYVGSGIAKCGREVFKEYDKLEGVGIEMTQPLLCTISYTDALKPVLFMQNYPSMLVARALDPQGGDSVLDMCASPGGKSSHLAYLLAQRRNTSGFSNSSGKLVSIDVKANKCKKIRELLDRYSLEAQVHCLDSMKLLQIQKDQLSKNTIQFELESFDKILLDPPCSGIGQRPCLEYDFPDASSDGICKIQKQLFSVACRLLKPGGVILYSTCTVNPLENEVVTKFALDNFDLDLLDIRNFFGLTENCTEEESIAKGFGRFGIRTSVSGDMILSEDDARKVLRFDHEAMKDIPASFDSVFFYVAGFRKPTVS